jgi:hypothetical protein
MLWSKKAHEKLLLEQNAANKLEWIEYYNKNRSRLSKNEIAVCEAILSGNLDKENGSTEPNYNVIADWLIGMNDETCFEKKGNRLLQAYFLKIDTMHWAKLAHFYPPKYLERIFKQIAQKSDASVMAHLLSILNGLSEKLACNSLVALQMKELPEYFSVLASDGDNNKPLIKAKSLQDILNLENRLPQNKIWVRAMASILARPKERTYVNTVLAKELISLNERTALAYDLLLACRDDLQYRINNKPQPPSDWTRPVPDTMQNTKQWNLLTGFLQSSVQQVFDYRKNQQERDALENAIQSVEIDLTTETIKKGSPHTLRIAKTQAAYKRQMNQWNEDATLLKIVRQKIEAFAGQSE